MIQCHNIGTKPNQTLYTGDNPRFKPDPDHRHVGKCSHCGDIVPIRTDPIRGDICAECDSDEDFAADMMISEIFGEKPPEVSED